jgi:hypothetical protein
MGATTGIAKIGDYTTPSGDANKVGALLALIPNPDAVPGTGAVGGGGFGTTNTYLDEMSPAAAAQLRVELLALQAAVT